MVPSSPRKTNFYGSYAICMRIKVCHIIPTLVQGGAEKQMALLAEHLPRDRFETHVVVLTHSGPLEEQLQKADVPVHLIGKRGKVDPTAYFRLERKIRELAPDVVHTWLFAANSYGRMAARRARVAMIVAGERCVDPWKTRFHFWVDRWLQKCTSTIATNSSGVVQFYSQHGIDADRFRVIPNAVLPPRVPPISREELFSRLKLPPRSLVVGAVGRLWKQKGYEELIWSGELLHVAMQDVWLVIIGDGPELTRLQRLRDQYGAVDSVRFAGHRRDAVQLMSAFDLLWNGSLYEGQSNTMLEAMSWGKPIIATDIPGNRDLVIQGETGFLYRCGDPGELVRRTCAVLRDPAELARLGANARARIQTEFSLEKMINSYAQLYEQSRTAAPRRT